MQIKYMKTDCFAYVSVTRCKALNDMVCKNGNCPFYKTKEQFEKDAKAAHERRKNRC